MQALNVSCPQGAEGRLYIDIGVGLSALLVSTTWAMREPLLRGTSDRTSSTFFVYIWITFGKHKDPCLELAEVCKYIIGNGRYKFSFPTSFII